ncbi:Na(+)-translocating NADH-quinone reductase subunit A [Teredinibacter purpureus]|uniref:Na(+)-translocating NADH-quinone reductase subunit A n=1 Tax=Teredinibacter purpureus TaxID=2731756 RepID=UPI0005F814A5|nr:Na(+)-translocating NADH-quinone reductase subunit A [Teredinibacter purpureus]
MIKIRRGLDLPITGAPRQSIEDGPSIRSVAVVGFDYHGMKPTMAVQAGDRVKKGQLLFTDKKTEGVRYTSPASGTVAAINRGNQRVMQSVVIDVDGDEGEVFAQYPAAQLASLERSKVVDNLVESGLWTSIRTRPFSKVPAIETAPSSVFVSAMDTNPLAADPTIIINERPESFKNGLAVLSCLTEGKLFVAHGEGAPIPQVAIDSVEYQAFGGVHPAGNVGTHMHFLAPVSATKVAWSVGYQDVMAIGDLFTTGQLNVERVISIAGPQIDDPRMVRTRLGANLEELLAGQVKVGENRTISGSVFGGRKAYGPSAFLGRYHNQVSVLLEGRERPFIHFMVPGINRFSALPIYISNLLKGKKFNFTTSANGSERAMVPTGAYERVMPLDILPTHLLRSIIVGDTEMAQKLGCLELDEEDLALCTFICSGKYEYGPILRDNLTRIEKEG